MAVMPDQAAYGHRRETLGRRAVAKLAVAVVAPGPDLPSLFSARLCMLPPAMAVTPVRPLTATGV